MRNKYDGYDDEYVDVHNDDNVGNADVIDHDVDGNNNGDSKNEGGDNEKSEDDDDIDNYDYVGLCQDWDADEEFDKPTEKKYEYNKR